MIHSTPDRLVRLRSHTRRQGDDRTTDGRPSNANAPDSGQPDVSRIEAKIIEDIQFLRDRIAHIKRAKLGVASPSILSTYESMLESRESALYWLREEGAEPVSLGESR